MSEAIGTTDCNAFLKLQKTHFVTKPGDYYKWRNQLQSLRFIYNPIVLFTIPSFYLQSHRFIYNLSAWLQYQRVIINKNGSLIILFVIIILLSIIPGYSHARNPGDV